MTGIVSDPRSDTVLQSTDKEMVAVTEIPKHVHFSAEVPHAPRRPLRATIRESIVGADGNFNGRVLAERLQSDDHQVMWELAEIIFRTKYSPSIFFPALQKTLQIEGIPDASTEQVLLELAHKILNGRLLRRAKMEQVSFDGIQKKEAARYILERIHPDYLIRNLSKETGACEEIDELAALLKEDLIPHLRMLEGKLLERIEPLEAYRTLLGTLNTMLMTFSSSTPVMLRHLVAIKRESYLQKIEDERPEILAIRERIQQDLLRPTEALGSDGVPAILSSEFITTLDLLPPSCRAELEAAIPSVFANLAEFRRIHDAKAALEALHGKETVTRLLIKEIETRNEALTFVQQQSFDMVSRQAFMVSRLGEVAERLGRPDPALLAIAIVDVVEGPDDADNADKIGRAIEKYRPHREQIQEALDRGQSPAEILRSLKK